MGKRPPPRLRWFWGGRLRAYNPSHDAKGGRVSLVLTTREEEEEARQGAKTATATATPPAVVAKPVLKPKIYYHRKERGPKPKRRKVESEEEEGDSYHSEKDLPDFQDESGDEQKRSKSLRIRPEEVKFKAEDFQEEEAKVEAESFRDEDPEGFKHEEHGKVAEEVEPEGPVLFHYVPNIDEVEDYEDLYNVGEEDDVKGKKEEDEEEEYQVEEEEDEDENEDYDCPDEDDDEDEEYRPTVSKGRRRRGRTRKEKKPVRRRVRRSKDAWANTGGFRPTKPWEDPGEEPAVKTVRKKNYLCFHK